MVFSYDTVGSNQEPSRNEQISVGLTAVEVAARRTDTTPRKTIVIRNTSPNATDIITLNLGAGTATANLGIVLRQYETFVDTNDSGYICWQGVITGICATATGKLSIFER